MKTSKKLFSLFLAAFVVLALGVTAFAADTSFSDVGENDWYANAVKYAQDNGLMNGTSDTTFAPNETTSRGQIATILYRVAGSPEGAASAGFTDVATDAYYAAAINWAVANGVVNGYGDGTFGPNDTVTRQQMAAILWRHAGSPAVEQSAGFADEAVIETYAMQAVNWAKANGIINGKENNRFDPNGNATRGEVAMILMNYLGDKIETPQQPNQPDTNENGKTLVVYYSASGNTEEVAKTIAAATNGDLFEIVPVNPYTSADLNYSNADSRVTREHEDESLRVVSLASSTVEDWADYDRVFIGYPIWWGIAAWPVDGFVKANNFDGKTVIPFCTSSSSGLGESGKLLADMAGTGDWQEGMRFQSHASNSDIEAWVASLK